MAFFKMCLMVVVFAAANALPSPNSEFWKGTPLDASIEEMKTMCAADDAFACAKYKFMSFLDTLFKKDSFRLTENVEVTRNSFRANEVSSRSDNSLDDNVQEYLQTHDVTFKLPVGESSVTIVGRNLDQDEMDLKLRFSNTEGQARKSKLKKIIIPIFVLVLMKAITLIPLAIGVLGLKAWNAMQLSFFSFVISVGLAVFQLCKKIASDGAHPQIAAHGPWEAAYSSHYQARSLDAQEPAQEPAQEAQRMAYSAHV